MTDRINKLLVVKAAIFLIVLALLMACTTIDNSLKESEYGGTAKVYAINEKQAWEISKTVFLLEGAKEADIEENRAKRHINWLGVMMAIIDPIDNKRTRIISLPAPSPCLPKKDLPTEEDFHNRFSHIVNTTKTE